MSATYRWMGPADVAAVEAASRLFDHAVERALAEDFLAQPNHHLCLVFADGEPAGFVSGVEVRHPDKPVEMLLYELGVDAAFRRRGIGRGLVEAIAARARELGCRGMWVPVEHDDEPALATYRSTRPDEEDPSTIIWWDFGD